MHNPIDDKSFTEIKEPILRENYPVTSDKMRINTLELREWVNDKFNSLEKNINEKFSDVTKKFFESNEKLNSIEKRIELKIDKNLNKVMFHIKIAYVFIPIIVTVFGTAFGFVFKLLIEIMSKLPK